jgi:hypothetical protein
MATVIEGEFSKKEQKDVDAIQKLVSEEKAKLGPHGARIRPLPPASEILPGHCRCGCGGRLRSSTATFIVGHNSYVQPNMIPSHKDQQRHSRSVVAEPAKPSLSSKRRSRIITYAYRDIMENPFPGDPLHRTGAELLALAMVKTALAGDVSAGREITDRLEGKVTDVVEIENNSTVTIDVIQRIQTIVKRLRGADGEGTPETDTGGTSELPQ